MTPRRALIRLGLLLLAAAFGLALVTSGPQGKVRADVYVAVLALLGLSEAWRWLRTVAPVRDERVDPLVRVRRGARGHRPPLGLLELQGLVDGALQNARAATVRFRPRMRDLARARLATRRGIDLDAEPERAIAIMGERAWELVQPVRGTLPGSDQPGMSLDEIRSLVDAVGRI